jgi:hypothetical protein
MTIVARMLTQEDDGIPGRIRKGKARGPAS